jgi:hypothetical protein
MKAKLMYWANDFANRMIGIPGLRKCIRSVKRFLYLRIEARLWSFFPTDQVIGGPFKGVRFPHKGGNCSVFFPKLIGCYEAELHPFWNAARKNDYKEIWDIGAADGYYAAGLAVLFPTAKVIAWEASTNSAENCWETLRENGVEDQVIVNGVCKKDDLLGLPRSSRSLIVCDIEGYEMELFDENVVSLLGSSDVVIELHEKFRPGVTERLIQLFHGSHNIQVIDATADEEKVTLYEYPPLLDMALVLRRYATAERRYSEMQWLVATVA